MEKLQWDQSKPVKKGHSTTPSSQDLMHGTNIRHNASCVLHSLQFHISVHNCSSVTNNVKSQ